MMQSAGHLLQTVGRAHQLCLRSDTVDVALGQPKGVLRASLVPLIWILFNVICA